MKTSKILSWLLLTFCLATTANATYRLQRVTSVTANNYYVFEQGGFVMKNSIYSNALQTTNTFSTSGLSGSEEYVWTLDSDDKGNIKMKNGSNYLKNESSTNLSFDTKSNSTTWTFSFQSDGTAIIGASNARFLGYTDASSHQYKCYSGEGAYGYQPHSIVVYQLVEETGTSAGLHFDKTFVKFVKGGSYTPPVLSKATGHDGVITYSSSNSKIATVNTTTGEVTIVGTGRVMITASSAATGNYDAGEATYTLMVMGGNGSDSKPYCVSDVNSGYMPSSPSVNVYVKGYVVGYYTFSKTLVTTPTDNTNIAIADSRDGATVSDITPLSLDPSIQSIYGLKAHPEEMGKLLTAYGSIGTLRQKTSVNTSSISFSPTYPVTITSYKYATYRTTETLDFSGTAVSAYTAEAGTDNVVLTKISDGKVPSGVGVILYSETAGTYDIPVTDATPTVSDTGLSISNGTDATKENGIYVLGRKNNEVGFYRWVGDASLVSGRVYLAPTASSAREYLSFLFDDETAGINNVNVNHNDNYYDLQGRHVEHPKRGLYLVNGKKVFIQ